MKITSVIIFLIFLTCDASIIAQTINIHSVASLRETSFDNGYTLDGDHMASSRAKLFNPGNFSDTGIYKKKITIYSAYYTSGSLEQITQNDDIDLFFFGSFNEGGANTIPFTQPEIDSLYEWSLRGGKLIIAEQSNPGGSDYQQLDKKWGYTIAYLPTTYIFPVEEAIQTKIFNGPFGVVERANMGGLAQGYFRVVSSDISVLGTDQSGRNTLYIDCKTRDLICADVDAYTDLGGLSNGDEILNDQDRFWANTIAFMDSLGDNPPPADIQYDGTNLFTNNYSSYQWLLNWDIIEGADSISVIPGPDGYYRVIVKDDIGCIDTSNVFVYGSPLTPAIQCPEDITIATDRGVNYATLTLPLPQVFDTDGIASNTNDAPDTFLIGVTTVTWTVNDSAGYSSNCSHTITVTDNERPTITCPTTLYLGTDPGQNFATVILETPVTHDNVFVDSLTNNAPLVFPIGTSRVLWTVYDSSGNYASCTQTISVADTENPEINCPPDTSIVIQSGHYNTRVELGSPETNDNDRVISVSNNAPSLFPLGSTMVTWTVRDNAGNIATCDQTVNVSTDNLPITENVLSFPNIITPNGDGMNDYFFIENLKEYSELIVFDRINKIQYQTDNYQNDWYGTDKQNTPLEDGTYWYILNTADGGKYSGYVIVKRG
jgi:gliding motility-associated-like protein